MSVKLARPLPLALDLDDDLAASRGERGVGEPDPDLDRLVPLIAAAVGLDLGLLAGRASFERARNRIVWIQ